MGEMGGWEKSNASAWIGSTRFSGGAHSGVHALSAAWAVRSHLPRRDPQASHPS